MVSVAVAGLFLRRRPDVVEFSVADDEASMPNRPDGTSNSCYEYVARPSRHTGSHRHVGVK
jgi:hypothetical protein